MRHKLDTAVFAQGWLEGQFENLVKQTTAKQDEDPTPALIAAQIWQQWTIVSEALDDLIAERKKLQTQLSIVESAFK